MTEQLHFNILSFDWAQPQPLFYFTIEETKGSHPIFKSKWSDKIMKAFPTLKDTDIDNIYTTFTNLTEGSIGIEITTFKTDLLIYKQYLNHKLYTYFKEKEIIVVKKNKGDIQVWFPEKKIINESYNSYSKFSLRVQFAQVSEFPELIVSFDGIAQVLKKPISEIEDTSLIQWIFFKDQIFNYQSIDSADNPDFYNSIDFNSAFPVLPGLATASGINKRTEVIENNYKKYNERISVFVKKNLFTTSFKKVLKLRSNKFLKVPNDLLACLDPTLGMLEYAHNHKGLIPLIDLVEYKPYMRPEHRNIKFFLIGWADNREELKTLEHQIKGGSESISNFKGIDSFLNIKSNFSKDHKLVYNHFQDALIDIKLHIAYKDFTNENILYAAFFLNPDDKVTTKKRKHKDYFKIKEFLLREGIVSQTIDLQKNNQRINKLIENDLFLKNIATAMHAKMGGIPWKLDVPENNELIIGLGVFKPIKDKHVYSASVFNFKNNGILRTYRSFTDRDILDIASNIAIQIELFCNQLTPSRIIIHFNTDLTTNEEQQIVDKIRELQFNTDVYLLKITIATSHDPIAFDNEWGNLMPTSGTIIKLQHDTFLLFNNERYVPKMGYKDPEHFSLPIKIVMNTLDTSTYPNDKQSMELLTQVYQFSRLYWKSLKQQNLPITVKYPEMLAQIATQFEAPIPEHAKDRLWFL